MQRLPKRVYGPHWYSWLGRFFGVGQYPEKMDDWQKSGLVPGKFWESLEYNQSLNTCCRHVENMTGRVYKTPTSAYPDLFIVTCTCGRNHYRWRVDPVNGEPSSIFDHPYDSGIVYE